MSRPSAHHLIGPLEALGLDSTEQARLPTETISHISTYLSDGEVRVLSSCSVGYRNVLLPRLWRRVRIRSPSKLIELRRLVEQYAHVSPDLLRLGHPLIHVREVDVELPERYVSLDHEVLLALMRGRTITTLRWSAEQFPVPALWTLLAPTLHTLEVDCKTFWPAHERLTALTSLRSLTLTNYDAHLSPPHLHTLLAHPHQQITHLSMSTSKTDILHSLPLIHARAFANLQSIDIFPVTPQPPLADALISAANSLLSLRIILDISPSFNNFNFLWSQLAGKLPHLKHLEVDPHPQQNTAPSFFDFLNQCPSILTVNGRRVDAVPPCLGTFSPDEPSGALPY